MDTPPYRPYLLATTPTTTISASPKPVIKSEDVRYGGDGDAGPSSPLKRGGEDHNPDLGWYVPIQRAKRIKWRESGFGIARQDQMEGVDVGYRLALLQDQATTLYPPPPTAFTSYTDVIDRLLPYHIWQIHDEELLGGPSEQAGPKREAREVLDADRLVDRIRKVHDRFDKIRYKDAHPQRPADMPHLINMINSSTSALRSDLLNVQERLKRARMQWESMETERRTREERIVKAQAEAVARVEAAAKARAVPVTPLPVKTAPDTPTSNGSLVSRGRGRPRGRGRGVGGLRETALEHTSGDGVPSAMSGPSTPAMISTPTASAPTTPAATSTPAANGASLPSLNSSEPINVSVSMLMVPQLVSLGIVALTPSNADEKPPATVVGNTKDKKYVILSLRLGACNAVQLQSLAKLLNVGASAAAKTSNGGGSGAASPAVVTDGEAKTEVKEEGAIN